MPLDIVPFPLRSLLEFIAGSLLIALASYILNLLGVISILVGGLAAALLALL